MSACTWIYVVALLVLFVLLVVDMMAFLLFSRAHVARISATPHGSGMPPCGCVFRFRLPQPDCPGSIQQYDELRR